MDYVQKKTAMYELQIVDREGTEHRVEALGLDTVTILPDEPDLSPLTPLLEGLLQEVLVRPKGQVDILLGLGSSALHGKTKQEWGDLRLLESSFGCGWVLRGCHESLTFPSTALQPNWSGEALAMSRAVSVPPHSFQVFHISTVINPVTEFTELNELGTTPAPVCTKCAGCDDCTFRRKRLSPADQEIVARIESEMQIDPITGIITRHYPWKACVSRMVDNSSQALKVQTQIKKHMLKAGTHSDFVEEMEKALWEGKVRELSESEMSTWHGPTHYISIFAVVKPDSVANIGRAAYFKASHGQVLSHSPAGLHYPPGRAAVSRGVKSPVCGSGGSIPCPFQVTVHLHRLNQLDRSRGQDIQHPQTLLCQPNIGDLETERDLGRPGG